MDDRFLKRLRKKAKKGLRGWPVATIALYGPNLNHATRLNAVVDRRTGRHPHRCGVAAEVLDFIAEHGVLSVAMSGGIIGCPHREGIDYDGEWCPVCELWHGRDRFTGERVR